MKIEFTGLFDSKKKYSKAFLMWFAIVIGFFASTGSSLFNGLISGRFSNIYFVAFSNGLLCLYLGYRLAGLVFHGENENRNSQDELTLENIELLTAQLASATEEISQLKQANTALPNNINSDISIELLEGKAKATALQLIGGLVMSTYKMDIHANRLDGLSEVVDDLALQGINISKETVSKWIKEAAKEIDQLKPK